MVAFTDRKRGLHDKMAGAGSPGDQNSQIGAFRPA